MLVRHCDKCGCTPAEHIRIPKNRRESNGVENEWVYESRDICFPCALNLLQSIMHSDNVTDFTRFIPEGNKTPE